MNSPENNELRAKEFLACLGNGKTEYQLDAKCRSIRTMGNKNRYKCIKCGYVFIK